MALSNRVVLLCLISMASSSGVPTLKLNNGGKMPAIALGTFLGFDQNGPVKSQNKQLRDVVMEAIEVGYRHFDTAAIYDTEEEIGEAIKLKIKEGAVKREDLFVTTKLWNTHHKRSQVADALKTSLDKLGLDCVDLYLMHWPIGLNEDYTHSSTDFMETWRGLEDAVSLGLAKGIGVSNFNREQLQRVLDEGAVKPVALQIEVHPQISQKELVTFAQSQGLVVMGYSPFGSLVRRFGMMFPGPRIDDPTLVKAAERHGKTTPQVVLRWLVDRNIVPVPKTTNFKRLRENIDIFDFALEKSEIEDIDKFDSKTRFTLPSFWQSHPYYPFEKVENPIADPFVKGQK
ncbi:aldo-keto reductase AKR2E4-like isoform X2 [Plodia interpunctella]|uniref:aldo-keto reductase AKR2E4-like isoform X2 n=1 Tax=Plodia interpunctella TaxID=58824 RepID=UPI0023679A59|nr:aldo-keto reductase AKR2E4-like isoform X2 [Plodia interpunctella]